ncbi:hypothetical protein [Anabaena sp. CCY 9402-a]|uniref:hypothetical protein n=1 Tax=Anabaena sp. CCY 9402-a TaxID=3103867 RepID=UPI0039C5EA3B
MIANNNLKRNEQLATQEYSKELAEIANQRYQDGCLRIGGYLQSGKPIIKDGKQLPAGVTVCDRHGNTGVLVPADFDGDGRVNAVAGKIAFTGSPPVDIEEKPTYTRLAR